MQNNFNFLRVGTYDVLSVTTETNPSTGYISYPAKVNRWSNGYCKETVNLGYLFTPESKGPKLQFQPKTLVNYVIKITNVIQRIATSGKPYYSYEWEIDVESTRAVQNNEQGALDAESYQDEFESYNEDPVDEAITQEDMKKLNDFIASVREEGSEPQEEEPINNSITPEWIKEMNDRIAASRKDNQ